MLKMKNINNYFKKNISEEKRYYLTAINIFICFIYRCSRFIYKVFIYMCTLENKKQGIFQPCINGNV